MSNMPTILELVLQELDNITALHRLWCETEDSEKAANLFRMEDNAKFIFRQLAIPVRWNEKKREYFFDIGDCKIEDFLS